MLVLALDTSLSACSAALWRDGDVLARRFKIMERGQSEALLPMVEAVMKEGGAKFEQLDLIGTTVGPGAFTGLRIGLAAARAMGLGARIPVAGVGTLEALACGVPAQEREGRVVYAVVDSKREDVFFQRFGACLSPLGEIGAAAPDDVFQREQAPCVAVGNGVGKISSLPGTVTLSSASPVPDAALVAALAARRFGEGRALPPTPLYLRAADTTCAPKKNPPQK